MVSFSKIDSQDKRVIRSRPTSFPYKGERKDGYRILGNTREERHLFMQELSRSIIVKDVEDSFRYCCSRCGWISQSCYNKNEAQVRGSMHREKSHWR